MAYIPPYIIPIWKFGQPAAGEILLKTTFRVPVKFEIPCGWAFSGTLFTADHDFTFSRSTDGGLTWLPFWTLTFPIVGTAPFAGIFTLQPGTWVNPGPQFTMDEGHALKVEAPAVQDDTGADIDIVLLGTRVGV